MRRFSLSALLPLLVLAARCATGHAGEGGGPAAPFLPVDTEDLVRLGSVQVDRLNRSVIARGRINLGQGLVELLACGPEGKTHESVLVLEADPVDLNAALLLLGLKPGRPPRAPGKGAPEGPPVAVWVEWEAEGSPRRVRGETLILNRRSGEVLPPTPWTYTGAVGEDGNLLAAREQSLVATFWDPSAVLNLPLPCGMDDEILFAHADALPPRGTPVTVRLHPARQAP